MIISLSLYRRRYYEDLTEVFRVNFPSCSSQNMQFRLFADVFFPVAAAAEHLNRLTNELWNLDRKACSI